MAHAHHLDEIAQEFFSLWRTWRLGLGWTLGPDRCEAAMSPYLVPDWASLDAAGRAWFTQHAALVVHAVTVSAEKRKVKRETPVPVPVPTQPQHTAPVVKRAIPKIKRIQRPRK